MVLGNCICKITYIILNKVSALAFKLVNVVPPFPSEWDVLSGKDVFVIERITILEQGIMVTYWTIYTYIGTSSLAFTNTLLCTLYKELLILYYV